jgi:hypothetical protein
LHAKRRRNRRNDQPGIAYRREGDETDRSLAPIVQRAPDVQRGLSFTESADTGEGNEPMVAHEGDDLVELGLSSDEALQRKR